MLEYIFMRGNNMKKFVVAGLSLAIFTSCSLFSAKADGTERSFQSTQNSSYVRRFVNENSVSFDTHFTRDDYIVVGDVTGSGIVKEIYMNGKLTLQADESLGFYADEGFRYSRTNAMQLAARIALYNALVNNQTIDYVLLPRYEFHVSRTTVTNRHGLIGYTNTIVAQLFGKGIRIKTDAERNASR